MTQPIGSSGSLRHAWVIGVGVALSVVAAQPAHADLAPSFVGKVSVDTTYVTGATGATDIAFSGDGRTVVTRKSGQIVVRRADGMVNVVLYPFPPTLDTGSEKGLLGVVADPDVATNRTFYFYVSNGPTNDKHRIYRAVLSANPTADASFTVDPTPVLALSRGVGPGLEGPANHDGGGMVIYNGQLYVGVGDTGFNATHPANKYGSCLNKGNGKVLRVNLDGSLPDGNPLSGLTSVTGCNSPILPDGVWISAPPDRRIFAWGFRNPWRIWVDPLTGLLWVGDVGEVTQEEISVGGGDQHYGYPFVEGTNDWRDLDGKNCSSIVPSRACTAPAYSYGRSVGRAVTGGLILDRCGWPEVFGGTPHYVFGDSNGGWIRALPVNESRTGFASSSPVQLASFSSPVSFRTGPDGALYVVLNGPGAVYRFTPTGGCGAPGTDAQVPAMPAAAMGLLLIALAASAIWIQRRRQLGR